ncbi:MAG: MgtC/SapB family protein [Magnetococcales bacterium]|nr:MgtC/SapB family protein [Magnetococcales bacterium]MBF0115561.1 MgtC/SapB family protein [Magnetococcales bacterium]
MESMDLVGSGINILIACFIGLAIGVERTITSQGVNRRIGLRDFIMVSILAFVSSLLRGESPQIWPFAFAGVLGYSLILAVFENMKESKGLVTELSFPITFLVAGLVNFNVNIWFIATLLFLMLLVMGSREQLQGFSANLHKEEIIDLAILIAIAITITPMIPKTAALPVPLFSHSETGWHVIFHPINVSVFWKVVVMVSFMSFGSHFITKYLRGRSALLLATFFGGLVSSLATIILLLSNDPSGAKKPLSPREVFLGYVAANTGSITKDMVVFFLVIGAAAFQNYMFSMTASLVLFASITLYSFAHAESEEIKITDRPLPIKFIFKFSFVFASVMIAMVMVTHYLGDKATIFASFFSGIISSAAALAAVGNALISNSITPEVAGWSAVAALLGSLTAKYLVIAKAVGWGNSTRYAMPVAALTVVSMSTLWMSFSVTGH